MQVRLFAKAKNNLTKSEQRALAYSVQIKSVGVDPRTNVEIWAPYVVWGDYVDITANRALEQAEGTSDRETREEAARKFLEEFLGDGQSKSFARGLQCGTPSGSHEADYRTCCRRATHHQATFREPRAMGLVSHKTGTSEMTTKTFCDICQTAECPASIPHTYMPIDVSGKSYPIPIFIGANTFSANSAGFAHICDACWFDLLGTLAENLNDKKKPKKAIRE
jgi:hypothetical protein